MQLERKAVELTDRGQAARPRKPDSGHTGTASITIRVCRASWNAMKPRIQCVVKPGSSAFGSGPIVMINGIVLQVHDWDSQVVVRVGGEGSITGHGSALGAQEPPQG